MGRIKSMSDYIDYCKEKDYNIQYSDIVYKQEDYDLFTEWFENAIKPFEIMKHEENKFSVFLSQGYFNYDWVEEVKVDYCHYGDGHCYEDLFRDYLESEFKYLNDRINYDSENGMFCLYCKDIKDAEEVCYELSTLYKDEEKMINLIQATKEKYNYVFEFCI